MKYTVTLHVRNIEGELVDIKCCTEANELGALSNVINSFENRNDSFFTTESVTITFVP